MASSGNGIKGGRGSEAGRSSSINDRVISRMDNSNDKDDDGNKTPSEVGIIANSMAYKRADFRKLQAATLEKFQSGYLHQRKWLQ